MALAPYSIGNQETGPRRSTAPASPDAVLRGHRAEIYAYIRRRGFSAEEADDLTQETLIRAYLHLSGFRGVSMGAWLYRIAANVSIDYLRKQRPVTIPLDLFGAVAAEEEDPVARLDRAEQREQVLSVIHGLPECHQRVLRLRYFEDRSMAEIALAVGCSPMAAKLRVFRAVTALRRRWRAAEVRG